MRQLLGSACILAGGFLVWLRCMAERRHQRDTLWELLRALRRMREEVRMARTPLPQLLERLADGCHGECAAFFHRGREALARGERWLPNEELPTLPAEAGGVVVSLLNDLKGDEENICKVISLVIIELEKEWENLERGRQAAEKQLTAMCFSGSALLVILLI